MVDRIPPSPEAFEEAFGLSLAVIEDIELGRVPLSAAALKTSRLARLLNDHEAEKIFQYEASGYPITASGVEPDIWALLQSTGRVYDYADFSIKKTRPAAFLESIEQLEQEVTSCKIGLAAAQDPNVSLSSANPGQYLLAPVGNRYERDTLQQRITTASHRLASRRAFIYGYASRRYYELKFSAVAQTVFSEIRESVDRKIGDAVPEAVQKFASIHDNLRSANPEDWSNAVHSCRRILEDLADALFRPQSEDRVLASGKTVKLGKSNYINRLMCFVEDRSGSERYRELVGSHLEFLGDRLDAVSGASQKGSHASVERQEANRYVVYTYMLVGDILSLR
jgi:hypothetical protein